MKNYYWYIPLLLFCKQLIGMDKKVLVPHKTVLSLQQIAFNAYVKFAQKNLPPKDFSEKALLDCGKKCGFDSFVTYCTAYKPFQSHTSIAELGHLFAEPSKNFTPQKVDQEGLYGSLMPVFVSPTGRYQICRDNQNTHYVVHLSEEIEVECLQAIPERISIDFTKQMLFSKDGCWLLGRALDPEYCVIIRCDSRPLSSQIFSLGSRIMEYDFMHEEVLFMLEGGLSSIAVRDLFYSNRISLLKKEYELAHKLHYLDLQRYKKINVFKDFSVIVLTPDEKEFQLIQFKREGIPFSFEKFSVGSSLSSTKEYIVHNDRSILLRITDTVLEMYKISGSSSVIQSTMPHGGIERSFFSPSGNYLACEVPGGKINIINCKNLESPELHDTLEYSGLMGWTQLGLMVCMPKPALITFNTVIIPLVRYCALIKDRI